jgi:hypothetical protein
MQNRCWRNSQWFWSSWILKDSEISNQDTSKIKYVSIQINPCYGRKLSNEINRISTGRVLHDPLVGCIVYHTHISQTMINEDAKNNFKGGYPYQEWHHPKLPDNFVSRRWGSSRKFAGVRVCRVTFKQLPQPLKSHILSFGNLGQLFKLPLFSAPKSHSAGWGGGS